MFLLGFPPLSRLVWATPIHPSEPCLAVTSARKPSEPALRVHHSPPNKHSHWASLLLAAGPEPSSCALPGRQAVAEHICICLLSPHTRSRRGAFPGPLCTEQPRGSRVSPGSWRNGDGIWASRGRPGNPVRRGPLSCRPQHTAAQPSAARGTPRGPSRCSPPSTR